jgi:hypothetical protein
MAVIFVDIGDFALCAHVRACEKCMFACARVVRARSMARRVWWVGKFVSRLCYRRLIVTRSELLMCSGGSRV